MSSLNRLISSYYLFTTDEVQHLRPPSPNKCHIPHFAAKKISELQFSSRCNVFSCQALKCVRYGIMAETAENNRAKATQLTLCCTSQSGEHLLCESGDRDGASADFSTIYSPNRLQMWHVMNIMRLDVT